MVSNFIEYAKCQALSQVCSKSARLVLDETISDYINRSRVVEVAVRSCAEFVYQCPNTVLSEYPIQAIVALGAASTAAIVAYKITKCCLCCLCC